MFSNTEERMHHFIKSSEFPFSSQIRFQLSSSLNGQYFQGALHFYISVLVFSYTWFVDFFEYFAPLYV